MVKVEQDFDGLLPLPAYLHRLAANDRTQRGEPLLSIEQEFVPLERADGLRHREISARHFAVGFPNQDCARRITPVQGVQQITDTGRRPNIAPLHLRESQFPAFNHLTSFPTSVSIFCIRIPPDLFACQSAEARPQVLIHLNDPTATGCKAGKSLH